MKIRPKKPKNLDLSLDQIIAVHGLWWLRMSRAERGDGILKNLRIIQNASFKTNSKVALTGSLAVNLLFSKQPFFHGGIDELLCDDPNALLEELKTLKQVTLYNSSKNEPYLLALNNRLLSVEKFEEHYDRAKSKGIKICHSGILFLITIPAIKSFLLSTLRASFTSGFYKDWLSSLWPRAVNKLRSTIYQLLLTFGLPHLAHRIRYFKLTEKKFRSIKIQPNSPLDIYIRHSSLALVTKHGKLKTFGSLIDYYSTPVHLEDMRKQCYFFFEQFEFPFPLHYNIKFWNSSNAFYALSIIYGLREGIPAYETLTQKTAGFFVSFEFYARQNPLSDEAICLLFSNDPPVINGRFVMSGRHKMFALAGHKIKQSSFPEVLVSRF